MPDNFASVFTISQNSHLMTQAYFLYLIHAKNKDKTLGIMVLGLRLYSLQSYYMIVYLIKCNLFGSMLWSLPVCLKIICARLTQQLLACRFLSASALVRWSVKHIYLIYYFVYFQLCLCWHSCFCCQIHVSYIPALS